MACSFDRSGRSGRRRGSQNPGTTTCCACAAELGGGVPCTSPSACARTGPIQTTAQASSAVNRITVLANTLWRRTIVLEASIGNDQKRPGWIATSLGPLSGGLRKSRGRDAIEKHFRGFGGVCVVVEC